MEMKNKEKTTFPKILFFMSRERGDELFANVNDILLFLLEKKEYSLYEELKEKAIGVEEVLKEKLDAVSFSIKPIE